MEALGAGLAAGIAAPPLLDLMTNLPRTLPGPDPLTGGAFAAGVLLGAPLALVTTGALWRSAWWARRTGAPAASGGCSARRWPAACSPAGGWPGPRRTPTTGGPGGSR